MIASGYTELDKLVKGFEKGKVYVVADRLPLEKSVIAHNFAYNILLKGHCKVLYFSLTQSATQMMTSLIALASGVSKEKIKNEDITPDELQKIDKGVKAMADMPLWIDDTPEFDKDTVFGKIRDMQKLNNVELVIIDGFNMSDSAAIHNVVQGLKVLSSEFDLPIIIITEYKQNPSEFSNQSLQWKQCTMEYADCVMWIQ